MINVGKAARAEDGYEAIHRTLDDGSAAEHFRKMMVAQGVEECLARRLMSSPDPLNELPQAKYQTTIRAKQTGMIDIVYTSFHTINYLIKIPLISFSCFKAFTVRGQHKVLPLTRGPDVNV